MQPQTMSTDRSSGSRTPERSAEASSAENACIGSEIEVDYLQLAVEAMARVQQLISPEHSRFFHPNEAQCRLLADALSEAVQSAEQETHAMDAASVRLCAPAFRELCRVAGDCEKLVRDCCKENWVPVAIMLADSKGDFLLRVSELKWCTRAWRTIAQHGLQGGAWLERFHKSSKTSVADRRTDMGDASARLEHAAAEDLKTLLSKLEEIEGSDDVKKEVRELASYVWSRCEMLGVRAVDEQFKISKDDLRRSGTEVIHHELLCAGSFCSVFRSSWFCEDFASKYIFHWNSDQNSQFEDFASECVDLSVTDLAFTEEVDVMMKIRSHPRTVRLLGVVADSGGTFIVMELMPSDLRRHLEQRMQPGEGRNSTRNCPFPLHVAVDIMLQIAEGVEVLHKHRLCHRDLKSFNVLVQPVEMQVLREDGHVRVKLADFGSTEARSSSFTIGKVGTVLWMAPEIYLPKSDGTLVYGAKADAFSFAIVCYEVLSGHLPLTETWILECRKHLEEGGMPELPATLPPRLASLVQRCWDEEPTKRPTFTTICKELRYLKFLITIGGEMQVRALDGPDEDAEATAKIVKSLRWIDHRQLRFIRHVGSGGYGSVDECELEGEGRVAVKNLLRCSSKVRVEEEAALLVRVQHRNVVRLGGCAFNEEERKGMIVMELMDEDLHHIISKLREGSPDEPPFSFAVALDIMVKVATAMKHIRSCNVLHRDLKTTNILVKATTGLFGKAMSGVRGSGGGACYDVKLADFGLSKYKLQDANFTTKASEAQLWRAPETSEARNYSWPADVFSFGVVCYEVLSGEVPFKGVQGGELLRSVRSGERPKIPTYYPTTVRELVDACWATDPEVRPDFSEICTKLKAFIMQTE